MLCGIPVDLGTTTRNKIGGPERIEVFVRGLLKRQSMIESTTVTACEQDELAARFILEQGQTTGVFDNRLSFSTSSNL
jgi:hypothetical protein